jgi:hypothetical protein
MLQTHLEATRWQKAGGSVAIKATANHCARR